MNIWSACQLLNIRELIKDDCGFSKHTVLIMYSNRIVGTLFSPSKTMLFLFTFKSRLFSPSGKKRTKKFRKRSKKSKLSTLDRLSVIHMLTENDDNKRKKTRESIDCKMLIPHHLYER